MIWDAPHVGFVLWCYGISAVFIGALIVYLLMDYRHQAKTLTRLEAAADANEKGAAKE